MGKKTKSTASQDSLFGNVLVCPNLESLPLITHPMGEYEVLTPGSVYQPILLQPGNDRIVVGPGRLDANEEQFIRDLIRYLYPADNPPKSEKTSLKWGNRDIWLKRNIEKDPRSFRLQIDGSDWFYPDFIVWILDYARRIQTFGFVDPKGLMQGLGEGWANYKIVSTLYMPHVLAQQFGSSQTVQYQDEAWQFRVRGVLVSTSSLTTLSTQAKFDVRNDQDNDVACSEEDFRCARIVFQHNPNYIPDTLKLLTEDTPLDDLMAELSRIRANDPHYQPNSEAGYDLVVRHEQHSASDAQLIRDLIKDYLWRDSNGQLGHRAIMRRRNELLHYAREGYFGFGAEKAHEIVNYPRPCYEVWKRTREKL